MLALLAPNLLTPQLAAGERKAAGTAASRRLNEAKRRCPGTSGGLVHFLSCCCVWHVDKQKFNIPEAFSTTCHKNVTST